VCPQVIPWLLPLSLYLGFCAGVFSHNHNHCPTFKSRKVNAFFGNWLSIFYGYPTFAWVPTHNLNHHKFVNKAGDATITWRHTNRHNWLVASTYFFVSAYWQSDPIKFFIRKAKKENPPLYRRILLQYTIWGGAHLALLGLSIALHGLKTGLYVYVMTLLIPAFFALWTIMLFNYDQHVHTDPWSKHNHSRSWDGKLLNFLLFNNGYHAAHHENAGAHWTRLPALFAEISAQVHPDLQPRSFWWFCMRSYVLSLIMPSFGTKQIGRAPFDSPTGEVASLRSADVDAVESGVNAVMV